MTGSTTPRKAATAQLMDSIPSTQPLDTTGAVSIATAPVLTGHPDNSDNVSNAQHSTMLFPDAMNALVDASLPLKAAAVRTTGGQDQGTRFIPQTPTTPVEGAAMRAMQQQQSVAQEQAQTNTIPEDTTSSPANTPTPHPHCMPQAPGPCRSGPDSTTIDSEMATHAMGGNREAVGGYVGAARGGAMPHSDQEKFANPHMHAMHPAMHARHAGEATSGSVNRTVQHYATGELPDLPPDPKNPLVYSQAVYNEQDEFVDNTGKYKLVMKGSYAAVEVALVPGDSVKAESGSMVSMSTNVHMHSKMEGTAMQALTRCCCSGESMFLTYYTLKPGETRGDLLLAPALPGEIMMLYVSDAQPWALQKAAYMASDPSITITAKAQNFSNACCSGEGLFVLKVEGFGRVCANSYGGIMRYVLRKGEERTIDNTYLVAWYEQMSMRIEAAGGSLGKSFLSGEGFVVTFTGPGIVYVQTRACGMFGRQ